MDQALKVKNLLNFHEASCDFFQFQGVKREADGIKYLVELNKQQKIVKSAEAKKFAIPVIAFLESKIQWVGRDDAASVSGPPLPQPRNLSTKVVCK